MLEMALIRAAFAAAKEAYVEARVAHWIYIYDSKEVGIPHQVRESELRELAARALGVLLAYSNVLCESVHVSALHLESDARLAMRRRVLDKRVCDNCGELGQDGSFVCSACGALY